LREEKGDFEGSKTEKGERMFALGGFPPIKIKTPKHHKGATEVVAKNIVVYLQFCCFHRTLTKCTSCH